jgi:hypothetical protein
MGENRLPEGAGVGDLHWALVAATGAGQGEWTEDQAGACPWYLRLPGALGQAWGVIVNPQSTRFARVTFEHDPCGCPPDDLAFAHGWPEDDRDDGEDHARS